MYARVRVWVWVCQSASTATYIRPRKVVSTQLLRANLETSGLARKAAKEEESPEKRKQVLSPINTTCATTSWAAEKLTADSWAKISQSRAAPFTLMGPHLRDANGAFLWQAAQRRRQ